MKKSVKIPEITRFNRGALRINARELRQGGLDGHLDALLAAVLGGDGACTEFTCTLYAP
jgi:hypothetical protein